MHVASICSLHVVRRFATFSVVLALSCARSAALTLSYAASPCAPDSKNPIEVHAMGNVRKDALVESGGHMVNAKGVWFIIGYNDLGNLNKDTTMERGGHMVNTKGELCITEYSKLFKQGLAVRLENLDAIALGEHHSHICISTLCKRGASIHSIHWEKGYPNIQHHCHDPEQ